MHQFRSFSLKGSNLKIRSSHADMIIDEIKRQRCILEHYISRHKEFVSSLKPITLLENAPPMAAVAGTIAQYAAERAIGAGADEAIVENGGDIFLFSSSTITIGLYAGGHHPISKKLAFRLTPDRMPCAICSSSSKMGHSLSFGNCDLATVISRSAPLADAAATLACNLVKKTDDIDIVLHTILTIKGIDGVLLVKDNHIGIIGDVPQLVKHTDGHFLEKITKDTNSEGVL